MNHARDVKGNDNFFKYISVKIKTRENVSSVLTEMGDLVTQDSERAEVLNAFACKDRGK